MVQFDNFNDTAHLLENGIFSPTMKCIATNELVMNFQIAAAAIYRCCCCVFEGMSPSFSEKKLFSYNQHSSSNAIFFFVQVSSSKKISGVSLSLWCIASSKKKRRNSNYYCMARKQITHIPEKRKRKRCNKSLTISPSQGSTIEISLLSHCSLAYLRSHT
jgi:hypothetical protein